MRSVLSFSRPQFRSQLKIPMCLSFQSLDYDICENVLYKSEQKNRDLSFTTKKDFARWLVFILIGSLHYIVFATVTEIDFYFFLFFAGVFTGITACIIDIAIELLSSYKYNFLKKCILFINHVALSYKANDSPTEMNFLNFQSKYEQLSTITSHLETCMLLICITC